MDAAINRLVMISERASDSTNCELRALSHLGDVGRDLEALLNTKNGLYVFDSALLVRPLRCASAPLGIFEWNDHFLWKKDYLDNFSDDLFFAEDAFGGQYAIHQKQICYFDPETGLFGDSWPTLAAWAGAIISDAAFRTGYPIANAWQVDNGPLRKGWRLLPKIPFVCGGKYEVGNLYALEDVKGMQFRAAIANQIRDLPDGSKIIFKVDR